MFTSHNSCAAELRSGPKVRVPLRDRQLLFLSNRRGRELKTLESQEWNRSDFSCSQTSELGQNEIKSKHSDYTPKEGRVESRRTGKFLGQEDLSVFCIYPVDPNLCKEFCGHKFVSRGICS